MRIHITLAFSFLTAVSLLAQSSNASRHHMRLQWSEPAKLISPDHAWELEVRPLLTADYNQSPVLLRRCQGPVSRTVLTLQRSAEAYWGPDNKSLLIVNEPVANFNELLLFDVASSRTDFEEAPDRVDEIVKQRLSRELGEKCYIEYYLPQFVSWKATGLVIAVGGATSSGGDGPMTSYCYGFLIDHGNRQIRSVISAENLKAKFGKVCRVSP